MLIGEKEVFMKVDKLVTSIVAKLDPTIKPFIDEKGSLYSSLTWLSKDVCSQLCSDIRK
jgi:hypothetical protein